MAEAKHILVVDDHFEMLEFLRSMLEMSNQDYQVLLFLLLRKVCLSYKGHNLI